MKPPHKMLSLISALSLITTACSSSPNNYEQIILPSPTYTQILSPLPEQPTRITPVKKTITSKSSNKTKDPLGHKPGPKNFSTVIIDAGHGGKDPGAVSHGITEKKLAFDIARRLKAKLQGHFESVYIRSGDYFVDLDQRVKIANKYHNAVLLSIHLNHTTSKSVRGPETYYFRVDSYGLAKRLQKAMASVSPAEKSRGLVRRRLRLTRNPQIPCVLLEIGYLSNTQERQLLAQETYRDRMATALATALKTQKKIGDSGMGKLPPPINKPLSRPTDKN